MIGDFMLGEGMVGGDAIETADYAATSAGVATAVGSLSSTSYLTVSSAGQATSSSTLSPQRALTSSATAHAAVTGAVTPKRGLTATAAGHATTSATTRLTRTCQASSAGVGLVTVIIGAGAASLAAHPAAHATTLSALSITHTGVTQTLAVAVHGQAAITRAVLDVTVNVPTTVPAPFQIHYGLSSGGPRTSPAGAHHPVKRGRFA